MIFGISGTKRTVRITEVSVKGRLYCTIHILGLSFIWSTLDQSIKFIITSLKGEF